MDESAAPWRALEDPVPQTARTAQGRVPSGRSPWVVAALVAAAALILVAFGVAASSNSGSILVDGASAAGDPAPSTAALASPDGRTPELVVDVQGAVARPGVVHLPAGSRVGDAITAAGGFGPRVAAERVGRELNMAALLRDGDQIVVPSRDDVAAGSGTSVPAGASHPAGPVDLNRATVAELDALPGIGPVTANKIISAREEQPFASVDDLRTRKILGAATFEKIKDLVAVR